MRLNITCAAITANTIGYYRKDYAPGWSGASIYIDSK